MRRHVVFAAAFTLSLWLAAPASAVPTTVSWGMDETSGTTMFGSDGVTNGTISGDVTLGVAGVAGTAYAFNENVGSCDAAFHSTGTGQVVMPPPLIGTAPFSFEAWVNTTSIPLSASGATKNCDFDLWRQASVWKLELIPFGKTTVIGVPHCLFKGVVNGAAVKVSIKATSSNVTDGAWHELICSRTAQGESLSVDGVVQASSSTNVGSIQSTKNVFVATQQSGQDFYQGLLDDISFTVG